MISFQIKNTTLDLCVVLYFFVMICRINIFIFVKRVHFEQEKKWGIANYAANRSKQHNRSNQMHPLLMDLSNVQPNHYEEFMDNFPAVKVTYQSRNDENKYGIIDKCHLKFFDTFGVYIGDSRNSQRHGVGIMLFEQGMYYEGDWSQDKLSGKGIFINKNGDFYEGWWKENLPRGAGTYVSIQNQWVYTGSWLNGQQNGQGKQSFKDGFCYEGDFKAGKRHGQGKYTIGDGRYCEGQFKDGEINGRADGYDFDYIYQGQWKEGLQSGTGKSEWYNRRQKKVQALYIGEYKNGKKHGFGQYRMEGATYKGKWSQGEMLNIGVLVHEQKN